jgi:FkbM family methyltransferase
MTLREFWWRAGRKLIYPVVPRRSRLPVTYWLNLVGGFIEPELRHLEAFCPRRDVAVDVGVHIGLFSYRLARMFRKVYAFEINDELLADLRAYNPGNIEIVGTGLSSSEGEATFYIPVEKNFPLTGWGSLAPNNYPQADAHLTKVVRVRSLDSYSLQDVSFIKIDVEGHEVDVLRGALNTISTNQPVVLVEVKEHNRDSISSLFRDLSCTEKSLERICGTAGSAENHIFLPRELNQLKPGS